MTLPWSTMEKIYTAKEGEFSVPDIPDRDELDQHLRRLAKERYHAPGMYHIYLVSDWWRTKLPVNKGTRWLKRGDWRQLIHKSTYQGISLPPGAREDHCNIHAVESLVFARETYTDGSGEAIHVVSQADGVDGEAGEGDLLIGQFGAYKVDLLNATPANAIIHNAGEGFTPRAVYKIGLEEVEQCLIGCTQERHQRRLALKTQHL